VEETGFELAAPLMAADTGLRRFYFEK